MVAARIPKPDSRLSSVSGSSIKASKAKNGEHPGRRQARQALWLLAICAVDAAFTWRRTGSGLPGALICGLFVTWYVVAGTAQAAF